MTRAGWRQHSKKSKFRIRLRTLLKLIAKTVLLACVVGCSLATLATDLAILRNGFEIRHEQHEIIGEATRLYLNADRSGGYVDIPTAEIVRYERDESIRQNGTVPSKSVTNPLQKDADVYVAVDDASKSHAIDPDLIASVIRAESSFNQHAVSPKGARGLMQLMPETASKLRVPDSFDAHANVDGGTRYLRELLLRYDDDLVKALAAYNAGPKRVDQYRGVPPYRETRQYVAKIIKDFNRKKLAQRQRPSRQSRKVASADMKDGQATDVSSVAGR